MKKLAVITSTVLLLATGFAASHALADRGYGMRHHMGGSMHGKHWMQKLTDQQRTQINKLRLDYKKKKYAHKAKLKVAKVDLAMLVTKNSPSTAAINKKIDQIVSIKRQYLRVKYNHKVQVRKVLKPEQRVLFDTHILKKAYRGKRRCRYGR